MQHKKGVNGNDIHTDNHLTLTVPLSPLELGSILQLSLFLFFWLCCLGSASQLSSLLFPDTSGFSTEKALKIYTTLPAQHRMADRHSY